MDLSIGGPPPPLDLWPSGSDMRPITSRLGPQRPPHPPLMPLQQERPFGYQARPMNIRWDHGPLMYQPSCVDQVEYQDRLELANYQ